MDAAYHAAGELAGWDLAALTYAAPSPPPGLAARAQDPQDLPRARGGLPDRCRRATPRDHPYAVKGIMFDPLEVRVDHGG
jgi:hypothetical protein